MALTEFDLRASGRRPEQDRANYESFYGARAREASTIDTILKRISSEELMQEKDLGFRREELGEKAREFDVTEDYRRDELGFRDEWHDDEMGVRRSELAGINTRAENELGFRREDLAARMDLGREELSGLNAYRSGQLGLEREKLDAQQQDWDDLPEDFARSLIGRFGGETGDVLGSQFGDWMKGLFSGGERPEQDGSFLRSIQPVLGEFGSDLWDWGTGLFDSPGAGGYNEYLNDFEFGGLLDDVGGMADWFGFNEGGPRRPATGSPQREEAGGDINYVDLAKKVKTAYGIGSSLFGGGTMAATGVPSAMAGAETTAALASYYGTGAGTMAAGGTTAATTGTAAAGLSPLATVGVAAAPFAVGWGVYKALGGKRSVPWEKPRNEWVGTPAEQTMQHIFDDSINQGPQYLVNRLNEYRPIMASEGFKYSTHENLKGQNVFSTLEGYDEDAGTAYIRGTTLTGGGKDPFHAANTAQGGQYKLSGIKEYLAGTGQVKVGKINKSELINLNAEAQAKGLSKADKALFDEWGGGAGYQKWGHETFKKTQGTSGVEDYIQMKKDELDPAAKRAREQAEWFAKLSSMG